MSQVLADWNGRMMPLDEVMVPALDRGHLLGDGVYEVIRIYRGRPFTLAEHHVRLERSLRELAIACDARALFGRLTPLLAAAKVEEGSIYMQVTRGAAPRRTHRFPDPAVPPNVLMYVSPLGADPLAKARELGAAAITHADLRWRRCDVKSINLLGNALANQAAYAAGATEAILVREDGLVTEGSHTNVFLVERGVVVTAPLSPLILPGITREVVLKLARANGIETREEAFPAARLSSADEVFLSGTLSEVVPVVTIDRRPVRDGAPGPVTERLQALYGAEVKRACG